MKLTQSGISIAKETFHFTLHEISLQWLLTSGSNNRQCFDAVSLSNRNGIRPAKNPARKIPKSSLLENPVQSGV